MKTHALALEPQRAQRPGPVRRILDDPFYTPKQIADMDNTSVDTVIRQIRKGRLKATKVSERKWGIRQSDYLEARKVITRTSGTGTEPEGA